MCRVTRSHVWMGSRCVKFGVIALTLSHTGHWKFNMAPLTTLWGSEKRIVAPHKDGRDYKKTANTLKLSCSTVTKPIQRFNRTGSTHIRPRHGQPKKLSSCAQRHIQRLSLENRCMSAASIAAEVEGVGGSACQYSDHTPHCIKLVCMAVVPEGSLF